MIILSNRNNYKFVFLTLSCPLVIISGLIQFLRVISIFFINVGLKSKIFVYISIGDIVPDVSMTDLKRVRTLFIPTEGSKQVNVSQGSQKSGEASS